MNSDDVENSWEEFGTWRWYEKQKNPYVEDSELVQRDKRT
jgi:hypothetical protein